MKIVNKQYKVFLKMNLCKTFILGLILSLTSISGYSQNDTNKMFFNSGITTSFIFEVTVGASDIFKLPLNSGFTYDFVVDFGEGGGQREVTTFNDPDATYTYDGAGTFEVKITGLCENFTVDNDGSIDTKITKVIQWGKIGIIELNFEGCSNLTLLDVIDTLDTTSMITFLRLFKSCSSITTINKLEDWNITPITGIRECFQNCTNFNHNIDNWDVSNVQGFRATFASCTNFNQPLNSWNTSSINSLHDTFNGATIFNQSLSNWDVSGVTTLQSTFKNTNAFNQDINNWDVGNVTTMLSTFEDADGFNQNILDWDVAKVISFVLMFSDTTMFNGTLTNWATTAVTNMSSMFKDAIAFNRSVDHFDVDIVTNFTSMFENAEVYNQDMDSWVINTSSSPGMTDMFKATDAFNGDISTWTTGEVIGMHGMFENATAFNQNLNTSSAIWDISKVINFSSMFASATAFNGTLTGWITTAANDMSTMFNNADAFSQPLDHFDMNGVTTTFQMFLNANLFNQNLNSWDVSTITTFQRMFENADTYNQGMSKWNTVAATSMQEMFEGTNVFNQVIGHFDMNGVGIIERFALSANAWTSSVSGIDVTTTVTTSLINLTSHGYSQAEVVHVHGLTNTTGFADNTTYYVSETSNTANSFRITTDSTGASSGDITFGGSDDSSGVRLNGWGTGTISNWKNAGVLKSNSYANMHLLDMSAASSLFGLFDGRTDMGGVDLTAWNLKTTGTIDFTNFNRNGTFDMDFGAWDASAFITMAEAFEGVRTASGNYDTMLENWSGDSVQSGQTLGMHATLCKYNESAGETGTVDATTTDKLDDSGATFLTSGVAVNDIVHNTTDDTYAKVTAIDSDTVLALDNDIMVDTNAYTIQTSASAKGRYTLISTHSWNIIDSGPQ